MNSTIHYLYRNLPVTNFYKVCDFLVRTGTADLTKDSIMMAEGIIYTQDRVDIWLHKLGIEVTNPSYHQLAVLLMMTRPQTEPIIIATACYSIVAYHDNLKVDYILGFDLEDCVELI